MLNTRVDREKVSDFDKHLIYYKNGISFFQLKEYNSAIDAFFNFKEVSSSNYDRVIAILYCAFLLIKVGEYKSAINQFSEAIKLVNTLEKQTRILKGISYYGRSESNYKLGYYKWAIIDRRKANKLKYLDTINYFHSIIISFELKDFLLDKNDLINTDSKFKFLLYLLHVIQPKYDLINDFKRFIDENRKAEIKRSLEEISNTKFKSRDYKGSIKAIRRAEKYN